MNGDEPEWYSEAMRFSEFIVRNLAFTLGVGLGEEDVHRGPARDRG